MPSTRQAPAGVKPDGISVLQLNVEGITKSKFSVIEHLLQSYQVTVILLQETHSKEASNLKISSYVLAAHTKSDTHGIASFVRHSTQWRELGISPPESSLEWAADEVEGLTIVNIYKPSPFRLQLDSIPIIANPWMHLRQRLQLLQHNLGLFVIEPRWRYSQRLGISI